MTQPQLDGSLDGALLRGRTLAATLQQVVDEAIGLVPGCDAASITLVRDGRAVTAASTHTAALELDLGQYAAGEGPCLEAYRTDTTVAVDCRDAESAWAEFVSTALAEGFYAFYATPLRVAGQPIGALNLYSRSRGGFDSVDAAAVDAFAARAAVLLANVDEYERAVRTGEQLREALQSRAIIEQAKGVLMATRRVSEDAAFDILREVSQRSNRKLRDVAESVVADVQRRVAT